MATIWKQTASGFESTPLAAEDDANKDCVNNDVVDNLSSLRIVGFRDGNRPSYVLITKADNRVRVNGSILIGGIRALRHKDELVTDSERMFFSAESTPVVETYFHDDSRRRPHCPICRTEIQDGQSIVRCPGCSRIYHQIDATDHSPAKPCWTYTPECRFCEHPSSMSGEPTWRPDEDE